LVSKPSEEDRRSQTLALTREGRRLFRQIAPLSVERQQQLLADFSESERKALFRALDRLIERADELLAESTDR
jgi:DNA-binding MarR family transcriptional regulator